MGKVFVSYRRQGAHALAVVGLAERLAQHFGRDRVFIDTRLTPGERYPAELKAELAASDVVVAVVHDGWVADFAVERRMDWVEYELETALHDGKTVIPVLLEQASQPEFTQVPQKIAEVTLIQSTPLRSAHYEADLAMLAATIERTPAAPEAALTIADPTGDQPPRPGLRLALRAASWGTVFAGLPVLLISQLGHPVWQTLMMAALLTCLEMAFLTLSGVLIAATQPRLDAVSRRHQERSFAASLRNMWPAYAIYLLTLAVIWIGLPLFDSPGGIQVKVLLTGGVMIVVAYLVQRQVRRVSQMDTVWPPPVTPDTLTFRRAASRLHELLIANQRAPRDFTRQRQAESVYHALVQVRAVLEKRTRRTRRQWLTGGRHHNALPAVIVGALGGTIGLTTTSLVISLSLGDAPPRILFTAVVISGAALVLAAVALTVSFLADRRSQQQLVEELREWDSLLHPLIFQ
ncbi:MAG: TIR domain-containing protein [Pseudonocardiaceae bacterium]